MRRFLVEYSTEDGNEGFFVESKSNRDLSMDITGGFKDEDIEEELEILKELDINFNAEDGVDFVRITPIEEIPTYKIK